MVVLACSMACGNVHTVLRRLHGFGPPTKALLESCESLRRSSLDPRASFYWDYSPTVQYTRVEADRAIRVCMGSWWDHWIIEGRVKCDMYNAWQV